MASSAKAVLRAVKKEDDEGASAPAQDAKRARIGPADDAGSAAQATANNVKTEPVDDAGRAAQPAANNVKTEKESGAGSAAQGAGANGEKAEEVPFNFEEELAAAKRAFAEKRAADLAAEKMKLDADAKKRQEEAQRAKLLAQTQKDAFDKEARDSWTVERKKELVAAAQKGISSVRYTVKLSNDAQVFARKNVVNTFFFEVETLQVGKIVLKATVDREGKNSGFPSAWDMDSYHLNVVASLQE